MKRFLLPLLLGLSLAVNAGVVAVIVRERVRIWQFDNQLAAKLRDGRAGVRQFFRLIDDWSKVRRPILAAIDTAYQELGRLGLQPDPDSVAVEKVLARLGEQFRLKKLAELRLSREFWALYRPEAKEQQQARIRAMRQLDKKSESRHVTTDATKDTGGGR